MTLISDTQMAAIRRIADSALLSDVTICNRVESAGPYGSDPVVTWPAGAVVKGWLMMTNQPYIDDRNSLVTSVGVFRLNMPATVTDLETGDQVEIEGYRYTVNDTNVDDTYRAYTTAIVRRVDDRHLGG